MLRWLWHHVLEIVALLVLLFCVGWCASTVILVDARGRPMQQAARCQRCGSLLTWDEDLRTWYCAPCRVTQERAADRLNGGN